MTTPITIRPAQQGDLPKIFELENEAFAPFGTAEPSEIISARLKVFNEGFLVAICEQAVAGYASSEKWLVDRSGSLNQRPENTHQNTGQIFYITALAVHKAQQGLGIGSMLLRQLIEIAKQHHCSHIKLETTHAAEFYRRHGFNNISQTAKSDTTFSIMQLNL